jgi:hypothetical protein
VKQMVKGPARGTRPHGAGRIRTDIEQRAPFPVVGTGWITRARKMPIIASRSEHWILSNRILAAGQHRGSTSAIRTALNALVAN